MNLNLSSIFRISLFITIYLFSNYVHGSETRPAAEWVDLAELTYVGFERRGEIKRGFSSNDVLNPSQQAGKIYLYMKNSTSAISRYGYEFPKESNKEIPLHLISDFFHRLSISGFLQIIRKVYEVHKMRDDMIVVGSQTLSVTPLGNDCYDIEQISFSYNPSHQPAHSLPEMEIWIEQIHEERTSYYGTEEKIAKYIFKIKFLKDVDFLKYNLEVKILKESLYIKPDEVSQTRFLLD